MARLRENGHVTEVVTLIYEEWSCYRDDQSLMKGACSCYIKWPVNGGSMEGVWLCYRMWSVEWRENGHSTEVLS